MRHSFVLGSVVALFSSAIGVAACSSSTTSPNSNGDSGTDATTGTDATSGTDATTGSDATVGSDATSGSDSTTGTDSGEPTDGPGSTDASNDATSDSSTAEAGDGAIEKDGGGADSSKDAADAGCITLTVLNAPTSTPWCTLTVTPTGGAATTFGTGSKTFCVASGTTVDLSAKAIGGFKLDPDGTWHDTTGTAAVSGTAATNSVTVTSEHTCVWACCPSTTDTTDCMLTPADPCSAL